MFYGEVIDKKEQEMGIENAQTLPMKLFVIPEEVRAIRELFDDDWKVKGSIIYLACGESFWVEDDISAVAYKLNGRVSKRAGEGIAFK